MILLQLFTRLWSAVIVSDIIIKERQIVIRIRFFFFFWAFLAVGANCKRQLAV